MSVPVAVARKPSINCAASATAGGGIADRVDDDAGLLKHLAGNGLLSRLAGLDESGEHRDPARWPLRALASSSGHPDR